MHQLSHMRHLPGSEWTTASPVFAILMRQGSPNFFVQMPHKLIKIYREGRTFYAMSLFRDMLYSTKSTNFSKAHFAVFFNIIFFIIDKMTSRAEWNGFAGRSLEIPAIRYGPRGYLTCSTLMAWAQFGRGRRGRFPLLFSDGGDIICYVPHFFLFRFCIWRGFKNKSDVCYILCEDLFMLDGRPPKAKLMLKQSWCGIIDAVRLKILASIK